MRNFELLKAHADSLAQLKNNDTFILPHPYDPETGSALNLSYSRTVVGAFEYIVIEGNFYCGDSMICGIDLDAVIYIHMDDRIRLKTRLIRDLTPGQMRGKDAKDIIMQFQRRMEQQDKLYTLPYIQNADILIERGAHLVDHNEKKFEYIVYKKQ